MGLYGGYRGTIWVVMELDGGHRGIIWGVMGSCTGIPPNPEQQVCSPP